MEKDSHHTDCSQGSLQHDKRNVAQKQANVKSVSCRRQSKQKLHGSYQIALEEDIAKLRRQLKQEVDTHRALERALTRTLGALPRFSPGLTTEVQKLVAEVAVLEEEVVHLEEFITILHQGLLHNEALNSTHPEQTQRARNQMRPSAAEGQGPPTLMQPCLLGEKRNSVIGKLLPSTINDRNAKPIFLGGSPTDGESKQKLSKSASFRRESCQRMPTHGLCYG